MTGVIREQEFDCVECGRHIIRFAGDGGVLCALCLFTPGWFRNEELREIFDPEHDGIEAFQGET
jgi:hypothetical protein